MGMVRALQGLSAAAVLAALVGCEGDDVVMRDRFEAVEARLAGIEKRLTDLDQSAGTVGELRERLDRLDMRLGSLETRVAQVAAAAAPSRPPAPAGERSAAAAPSARPSETPEARAARERLAALRSVQDEYRRRLDELNALRDAGASPEELRAERSELSRWYREQRRAVLFGAR